jgi:hypothetical protein
MNGQELEGLPLPLLCIYTLTIQCCHVRVIAKQSSTQIVLFTFPNEFEIIPGLRDILNYEAVLQDKQPIFMSSHIENHIFLFPRSS